MTANKKKIIWIKTEEKNCVTTALECGLSDTFLVQATATATDTASSFRSLGRLNIITMHPDGTLTDSNSNTTTQLGKIQEMNSPEDLAAAQAAAATVQGIVIMQTKENSGAWSIIPAENLVAAFQNKPNATLMALTRCADDAVVMLGALEVGTDGVVLETNSVEEVRALAKALGGAGGGGGGGSRHQALHKYSVAVVTSVKPVAPLGDRVCVDLASNMVPGEGMLVGSFARAMFLVHSECEESGYINSRPFRVNAGPVHSYVQSSDRTTRYLAELKAGDVVVIADAGGWTRTAVVGRCKIEKRGLVLVEAGVGGSEGDVVSILLQNAETVKLVGPGEGEGGWRAVSVAELSPGDSVFVLMQGAARHTGIEIEESITER